MNLEDYLSMLHKLAERDRKRPDSYLKNSPTPPDQIDPRDKNDGSSKFNY